MADATALPNAQPKPEKEQPSLENPLDQGLTTDKNASNLIQGIVSTETKEEEGNILEAAPELDMSLLQDIEPPKSLLLLVLKIFFVFILVAGITSITFFSSQLTSSLDFVTSKIGLTNVSKELSSSNSQIIKLQTEMNVQKILQVKAHLDELSYYGDSFVQNYDVLHSQTANPEDVEKAENEMVYVKPILREAYFGALENYASKYAAAILTTDESNDAQMEQMFRQKLITELQNKANQFNNNSDPEARREYKNYMHAINLVGNAQLYNLLAAADFDDMDDNDLYKFIKQVNNLTVNDLSIIQQIKTNRIRWSDIMNEIDLRTIAVDKYYNSGSYELLGGIRYTSYDIDSEQQKITIVGETKLFDTINFTMISDLIDELNRSKLFDNAEMRSFTKSGSLETGYTANLRLSLDLKDIITGETKTLQTNTTVGDPEEELKNLLNQL